jgi:hypothetical protein
MGRTSATWKPSAEDFVHPMEKTMDKLTDKQKKIAGAIVAALLLIHYAPTILSAIAQQSAAHAPARVSPPPPPVAAAPVVPAGSANDVHLGKLAGLWSGGMLRPNHGVCSLRLELRKNQDKPGTYTGYSTMACGSSLPFLSGRVTPQTLKESMKNQMTPASAILSGGADGESIALQLEQTASDAPDGCGIASLKLTPFGDDNMAAAWEEGPAKSCAGGKVIMHRVPR